MSVQARDLLLGQLDLAWRLAQHHLESLTTEECLWRPAASGLHVRLGADGDWRGETPVHERYDLGPSSIGWITWHWLWWWTSAQAGAEGRTTPAGDHFPWPGDADGVRTGLADLHGRWRALLAGLDDAALAAPERSRWPYPDRPFGEVVAWANVELVKSAAELGYARFLYAARRQLDAG